VKFKLFKYFLVLLIFCLLSINSRAQQINNKRLDQLSASALKPYGRFILNEQQELELISSGVHVGFSFEGKQCTSNVSLPGNLGHNYLQYELDGVYPKKKSYRRHCK